MFTSLFIESYDDEDEEDMDIDKCLICGRYRSGWQLDEHQLCKTPCQNPNEY